MALKLANNAVGRLSASLSTSDTVVVVGNGEGIRFPVLAAGDWFPLTLIKADGSLEVMRCTARNADSLTVERAQEGTTTKTFSAGDRVELRFTAQTFDQLSTQLEQRMDTALIDADLRIDAAEARVDGFVNLTPQSVSFTASRNSRYWLPSTVTVTLPAVAGMPVGTFVELSKAQAATPIIQATDGTQILVNGQADTSVIYNLNARLLAVYNGTAWEI